MKMPYDRYHGNRAAKAEDKALFRKLKKTDESAATFYCEFSHDFDTQDSPVGSEGRARFNSKQLDITARGNGAEFDGEIHDRDEHVSWDRIDRKVDAESSIKVSVQREIMNGRDSTVLDRTSQMPGVIRKDEMWVATRKVMVDGQMVTVFSEEYRTRILAEIALSEFNSTSPYGGTTLDEMCRNDFETEWNAPSRVPTKSKIAGGKSGVKGILRLGDMDEYNAEKAAERIEFDRRRAAKCEL